MLNFVKSVYASQKEGNALLKNQSIGTRLLDCVAGILFTVILQVANRYIISKVVDLLDQIKTRKKALVMGIGMVLTIVPIALVNLVLTKVYNITIIKNVKKINTTKSVR